jgi:3-hydroxybutyryl-CoA dehydrogenase
LIGLDTVMRSLDVLYENFHDPKYRCCPLLRKLVHAGHLGRKTGRGFHAYPQAQEIKREIKPAKPPVALPRANAADHVLEEARK